MVKVRMNTADVAGEVKCLRKLIGMRCANVYDISPKVEDIIQRTVFANISPTLFAHIAICYRFCTCSPLWFGYDLSSLILFFFIIWIFIPSQFDGKPRSVFNRLQLLLLKFLRKKTNLQLMLCTPQNISLRSYDCHVIWLWLNDTYYQIARQKKFLL